MAVRRIVVDALQVGREPTGLGRQVQQIGSELFDLPDGIELELRCSRETAPMLVGAFPPNTVLATPIATSRRRLRRIVQQQIIEPRRDGPDTLLVCLGDQAPLAGRARLLAIVNDARRLTHRGTSPRIEGAFFRFVVPRVARRADLFVTISDFSRTELLRVTGCMARTVAAHPRRPVDDPPPPGDGRTVLVVGALRRYKGIDTVIDALALLPAAIRPRVICAGPTEGRGGRLLRRAQAQGVREALVLVGWVDDHALEALWREASVCLCPSTYEGYGLPVAESLARGIATVASDIPPHREIGGDALLLFEPGDARSLSQALETVLRDAGLRVSLGRRGLARSHELARATPGWRTLILEAASG